MLLKSIRGDLLENKNLLIELERKNVIIYKNNLISNENGLVEFTFDPNNCDLCSQEEELSLNPDNIKFTAKSDTDKYVPDIPHYRQLYYPQAIKYLEPWVSKHNSYIQLYEEKKTLNEYECNDQVNIKMKIRTKTILSNLDKIFFDFQSRSNIVASGYYKFGADHIISAKPNPDDNLLAKISLIDEQSITLSLINSEDISN